MVQVNTAAVAARFAITQVLIVDDDASTRKLVKALLNGMGLTNIIEAGDGMVGLDLVQKNAPDVIILDWQMPRLQGPNFMRIVRSPDTFPYPAVPVIMLTGHGENSKVEGHLGQRQRVLGQARLRESLVGSLDSDALQSTTNGQEKGLLRP